MGRLYDEEIYEKVGRWFEAHKDEMIADLQKIVSYPSIANHNPEPEEAPFGQACRDVLDAMLELGRKYGIYTENKEYYVGIIGKENPDWSNTIGMWNHLDVKKWSVETYGHGYEQTQRKSRRKYQCHT